MVSRVLQSLSDIFFNKEEVLKNRAGRMKLVMIVNVDWFFLSHRLPVALDALRSGYEVHIVTTLTKGREQLEAYGFKVHEVSMDRSGAGLAGLLVTLYKFIRLFWRIRPDVVHLVTIKPVLLGGLAARVSPVGGVVFAISGLGHVFVDNTFRGRVRKALVGMWYRFILSTRNMRIIFQNPDDRRAIESVAHLDSANVAMIPGSGVDLKEYSYTLPPEGESVVLMAARLLATKGVREYVAAARILSERGIKARFLLVGAPDVGNPASVSESELLNWADEGAVEWLGHRSDLANLMGQAHVVVLPSYYGEGLPKVLIEAAACGRAVVTTDMPGCRDAIEPGVTGLLIPPRSPEAIADAVAELIQDDRQCLDMGLAGRERAEKLFDVQAVGQTHLSIYQSLRELELKAS